MQLKKMHRIRRIKGAFAVEALGALALLALLVGYVIYNSISSNNESLAESAATHHQAVARGASLYVRDNYNSLVNQLNAGGVKTVSVSELKAAGYLPNGLSAYNPWGQELELKLKKGPSKNPIEGLVVSKGGEPIDLKLARLTAEKIGADGGYTVASGDYCGARVATSDLLCGTNGVWEYPSSEFALSGQGTGYIASALFFKDGMQLGEYLYRKAVPGKEELNQMDTYLRMGEGAVAAEGKQCGDNMKAIAMSDEGLILSCQGGVWKSAQGGKAGPLVYRGSSVTLTPTTNQYVYIRSGYNRSIDVRVNGIMVAFIHQRDKYGQGYVSYSFLCAAGDTCSARSNGGTIYTRDM